MSNLIKYSTTAQTQALKTGDFWIATGDVLKGSTSTSGFWNGISPPTSGYTIYLNKASQGPSIYVPTSDSQLIDYTNKIGTQSFTSVTQCFNWYNTQSDKMVFNKDYPAIITSGLVLNLDATFLPSYSTSGTTWYDLSPSGNNGTLTNGPTYSSSQGGSIVFDGIDDYVTCDSTSTVNFTDKFTISLWIYINALPTNGNFANLITKYNVGTGGNGGYDFRFRNAGGTQQIGLITLSSGAAEGGSDFNYTLSLNTWHYLSGVYNGSTSQVYLNTSLIGSVSNTTNPASNNKLLNIARFGQFGDTTLTRYYNGRIGQVKMYNRALSSAEILQNFYGSNIVTSGLTLYLDAGNIVSYPQTGTVWYDISGKGYNFTLINGPTYSSTFGGGIEQDGTNDYIERINTPELDFSGNVSFTIQIIAKNKTIKNDFPAIMACGDADGGGAWQIDLYNQIPYSGPHGVISFGRYTTGAGYLSAGGNCSYSFTSTSDANSLNYWCYVYSSIDGGKLYRNGNLIVSNSTTGSIVRTSSPKVFIGRRGNYANRITNCIFYQIVVYDRALSAQEVSQNYNAQKSKFGL